jgi:hypothetical protein
MFRCFRNVKMAALTSFAIGLITLKDLVTSVENFGLVCITFVCYCKGRLPLVHPAEILVKKVFTTKIWT